MTYEQSNYAAANPTASLGCTLAANVSVGDLVVVLARFGGTAPFGISDNLGNSWTLQNASAGFQSWYSVITTGGSLTVTCTQSSGRLGVAVHHYSGNDATPADIDTAINSGTAATSSATPSFSTSVSDGVAVGMWGSSATPTPEATYGGANLQGNGTGRLYTCHRLFSSTLTGETVDWTHASTSYQCKALVFKSAAAAAAGAFPFPARHPMAHLLVR